MTKLLQASLENESQHSLVDVPGSAVWVFGGYSVQQNRDSDWSIWRRRHPPGVRAQTYTMLFVPKLGYKGPDACDICFG
jgi:hypothetical protein